MQSPQSPDSTHAEVAFGEGYPKQYGSTDKPTAAQSKEVCTLISDKLKCPVIQLGHTNLIFFFFLFLRFGRSLFSRMFN